MFSTSFIVVPDPCAWRSPRASHRARIAQYPDERLVGEQAAADAVREQHVTDAAGGRIDVLGLGRPQAAQLAGPPCAERAREAGGMERIGGEVQDCLGAFQIPYVFGDPGMQARGRAARKLGRRSLRRG
jgi:hypothetical protein